MWIGIWRVDIVNGKARDCLQKKNGRRLQGGQTAGSTHGEMKRIRGMRIQGDRRQKMRSWEDGKMRKTSQPLNLLTSQPLQLVLFRRISVLTVSVIWGEMWLNGHPPYIVHIQGVQWLRERHLRESSMLLGVGHI